MNPSSLKYVWLALAVIAAALVIVALTSDPKSTPKLDSTSNELGAEVGFTAPTVDAPRPRFSMGLDLASNDSDPRKPYEVSDDIIDAVIFIESSGNPNAVGSKGERGLMQVMPDTWQETTLLAFGREITFDRAFEPELNVRVGTAFLEQIAERIIEREDEWRAPFIEILLASYNAGPGAVERVYYDLTKLPEPVQSYARRGAARVWEARMARSGEESVKLDPVKPLPVNQ